MDCAGGLELGNTGVIGIVTLVDEEVHFTDI